jgi:hypothetical protein
LNIIIQRDKIYGKGVTKENTVLKDLKELRKLLKENHYIYEVIPEHLPRYFFMDVDANYYYEDKVTKENKENFTEDEKKYLEENDIIEILRERISEILDIEIEDLVILQSLPTTDKLSYHLVFRDIILRNNDESKALYKYIEQNIQDIPVLSKKEPRAVLDGSIYTKNRPMRLLNQSKIGKQATLQCISGHKKYEKLGLTCIYEEELQEDDFFDVEPYRKKVNEKLNKEFKGAKGDIEKITGTGKMSILHSLNRDGKRNPDYEEEDEIKYLLSCIPNDPLQPYEIWLYIGFILKNQNCSVKYWIDWTNKGYKVYGEDKTNEVKNQWNNIGSGLEGGLTFRSLLMMASFYETNPLEARITKHITKNGEINIADLDLSGIEREIYDQDYVKPYDLEKHDVILERSALGTGKTTAIKDVIRTMETIIKVKKTIKKYKYKRILFLSPRVIFAKNIQEEFKEFDFKLYKDKEMPGDLSKIKRLIISLESLKRINEPKQYDLIVVDEMETILYGLSAPLIRDLKTTTILLEKIMTDAKKIIGMDAFLSERSIAYIRETMKLRNSDKIESEVMNGLLVRKNLHELKEKEAIQLSKEFFKQKLYKSLKAGERVVLFSGSKTFLKEEVEPLVTSVGLDLEKNMLIYTQDTDDEKKNDVKDIRNKWSNDDIKLLCYTPCITVGVNYDIPDNYDCIFCYALPSCLVRDYFQAIYRVRETRKQKLYYTIQSFYTERKLISKTQIEDRFKRNIEKNKKRHEELIKTLGLNEDFESPPKWLIDVHICNISEKNLSDCHFRTMFKYYLKINNYVEKKETLKDEKLDFKKNKTCLEWDDIADIRDISNSEAGKGEQTKADVEERASNNMATEVEKLQLRKFYINHQLKNIDEEYKKKIWLSIQQTEKMKKFYRVLYEINNNTKALIEMEFKQKTYGAFVDNLTTSFPLIEDLMNTIGLKNSCDNQTVIDQKTLTDNADKIKKLSKKIKDGLGILDRRKNVDLKKKNTKLETELKNLVNDVIAAWSGSSFKSKSTRKRVKGKRETTFTYYVEPLEGLEGLTKVVEKPKVENAF